MRGYYDDDDEKAGELWGRCAEVEGLFMDPPPRPREILTLRGCPRESGLARAVTRSTDPVRLLGDVSLFIHPEDPATDSPRFWALENVTVLAHRPSPGDPDRVDITVGAGVEDDWGPRLQPAPQIDLSATDWEGSCLSIDGLSGPRPRRQVQPLHLIGCEPAEPLLAELRSPQEENDQVIALWALDRNGRRMSRYNFQLRPGDARPSVLGGTLIDITVPDPSGSLPWLVADRPTLAARQVWDVWYDGIPTQPNQWARFDVQGRKEWLDLCRVGPYGQGVGRSGGTYHLDGQYVTEKTGLLLALGEALLGPGGTYGSSLDSVRDHLGGGPSVFAPFTLVWHHADTARAAIAGQILGRRTNLSYFDATVNLLKDYGVTVTLK
ncbi:barstar family protein [Kitasatospora sp. RG8]|uniref:barstar family protein n=1 Tax=Kitasatospora sp. RG8 TaxID=2820815 RepID=UPI001AE06C82|nr:barstar family protein [Kitasatospora sp. RG8]MBP0450583.1 barstar family protein [Kitasatospora sp. RG8]